MRPGACARPTSSLGPTGSCDRDPGPARTKLDDCDRVSNQLIAHSKALTLDCAIVRTRCNHVVVERTPFQIGHGALVASNAATIEIQAARLPG